jgi:hypothetical protein
MRFQVVALWVARELGHLLALGGMSQEFISWMHRAISRGKANTTMKSRGKFHVANGSDASSGTTLD